MRLREPSSRESTPSLEGLSLPGHQVSPSQEAVDPGNTQAEWPPTAPPALRPGLEGKWPSPGRRGSPGHQPQSQWHLCDSAPPPAPGVLAPLLSRVEPCPAQVAWLAPQCPSCPPASMVTARELSAELRKGDLALSPGAGEGVGGRQVTCRLLPVWQFLSHRAGGLSVLGGCPQSGRAPRRARLAGVSRLLLCLVIKTLIGLRGGISFLQPKNRDASVRARLLLAGH